MKLTRKAWVLALSTVFVAPLALGGHADAATGQPSHSYYAHADVQIEAQRASEQGMMGTLWFQTAVEAKALYIQAYNVATRLLPVKLAENKVHGGKPPAIILDIDETVLDNSPQQAYYATGHAYPEGWAEWVQAAEAKPLPGAKEFLQYASSKGVAIYYVSDRKDNQLEDTILNLKKEGFPDADAEHVLLKKSGMKSKEGRRDQVRANHDVIMYFGDNIVDFEPLEGLSLAERNERLAHMASKFGDTYFILPNPMYGSWEAAVYDNNFKRTPAEKMELRRNAIQVFDYKMQ